MFSKIDIATGRVFGLEAANKLNLQTKNQCESTGTWRQIYLSCRFFKFTSVKCTFEVPYFYIQLDIEQNLPKLSGK